MTPRTPPQHRAPRAGSLVLALVLLWLAGNGLRMTILAPPPVISLIHADLGMSETAIGVLSGIPGVLFALAAVPGALLIARFGAQAALVIGLLATGLGSALRGAAPDVATLYATTVLTAFGVAVMQPAMPSLVRAWAPGHVGLATAVYSNGLLIGEVAVVALTLPVVLPVVGSWRGTFVVWGAVCVVIALLIVMLAPRRSSAPQSAVPRRWWPDWRSRVIWKLGLMLGAINATYFSSNFFIPRFLEETSRGGDVSAALIALNAGQIPASLALVLVAGKLEGRVWPYAGCGLLILVALIAVVFGNYALVIGGSALLGFSAAAVLILMLALPAILSAPEDVHRTAAAMFTIGYACGVVVPVLCGVAWDLSGVPALAFLPVGVCAVVLMVTAMSLRIHPYQPDSPDPAG